MAPNVSTVPSLRFKALYVYVLLNVVVPPPEAEAGGAPAPANQRPRSKTAPFVHLNCFRGSWDNAIMHDARCDGRADNININARLKPLPLANGHGRYISYRGSSPALGVFYTYFYDHARRLRLEQLSCLGLSGTRT
jgi:hypothetical protein